MSGSNTVEVAASPAQVWSVLADVRRVPEWSHECHHVAWLGGATEGAVGARFKGSNRVGRVRWARPCTVTDLVSTWPTRSGVGLALIPDTLPIAQGDQSHSRQIGRRFQ